jgi:hypothetical protein
MRFSTAPVLLLALASSTVSVQAAPLPSFNLASILSNVLHTSTQTLQNVIESFETAVGQSTDANKHGKVTIFNPLSFVKALSKARYNHACPSTKAKKFPGWKKYKANGVNLGTSSASSFSSPSFSCLASAPAPLFRRNV